MILDMREQVCVRVHNQECLWFPVVSGSVAVQYLIVWVAILLGTSCILHDGQRTHVQCPYAGKVESSANQFAVRDDVF